MDRSLLVKELENRLGKDKVISDPVDLMYYSYDSSFLARLNRFIPDAVVTPRSTEEVSAVMQIAYANDVPVTPRGAGTGETCGSVAIKGGIVMDLSPWDTIEEIDVHPE
jgi:glycolate oxidase